MMRQLTLSGLRSSERTGRGLLEPPFPLFLCASVVPRLGEDSTLRHGGHKVRTGNSFLPNSLNNLRKRRCEFQTDRRRHISNVTSGADATRFVIASESNDVV